MVASLNTSDPNVVMIRQNHHTNGTRVLTIVLLLMFTVILTLVGYRRCGSRAAAWYLIRFSKGRHTGDEEDEASYLTTNLAETDFYANFQTQTIINGTGTRSTETRENNSNDGKSKTEQTYVQPKTKLWKSSLASTLSKSKTSSTNEMKTPLWSNEENDDEDQEDDQHNIKGKWPMVTAVNGAINNNNNNNSSKTYTEL